MTEPDQPLELRELTSPPQEPPGRRPWRYGELTRDDVVKAGLRLTRRSGFANLSMRKLAAELGSPSMNAYYYVHDKDHLLDLVGDAVLGEVFLPPADLPWDRRLRVLFQRGREVLLRYPGVAQHLLRRQEGLPNETRLYRAISEILGNAGFDRVVSDRAQRLLAYLLFGAVTSELATAEAAEHPGTVSFHDDEEVFCFGLELLLDGMRGHQGKAK
jgi:AcrR family transcriptional regulator